MLKKKKEKILLLMKRWIKDPSVIFLYTSDTVVPAEQNALNRVVQAASCIRMRLGKMGAELS